MCLADSEFLICWGDAFFLCSFLSSHKFFVCMLDVNIYHTAPVRHPIYLLFFVTAFTQAFNSDKVVGLVGRGEENRYIKKRRGALVIIPVMWSKRGGVSYL